MLYVLFVHARCVYLELIQDFLILAFTFLLDLELKYVCVYFSTFSSKYILIISEFPFCLLCASLVLLLPVL